MRPLNYTLYSKVKEKFAPQAGVAIFVSLAPENIEHLNGLYFSTEEVGAFRAMAQRHADNVIPYAVIYGLEENEFVFYFGCREFEQEENLLTGEIIESCIGTYHNNPIGIEAVKRDLQKLSIGSLLEGNA